MLDHQRLIRDPRLRRGLLAGWCLLLLLPGLRLLGGAPIYGDDHSSHLVVIEKLVALIEAGQTDFYCPTFNLGFPMYVYYQPLPHLLVALLHILSLGLLSIQAAFNLSVVLAWSIYPLTTYGGARRLGLDADTALLCALCAPLVSSVFPFGFTVHTVMGLGLFTQTFAMALFPLALGTLWQSLAPGAGRREQIAAAGLLTLVCLCHAFYGVVLATASIVMVLTQPRRLRQNAPRLLAIGGLVAASLAFWLLPLLSVEAFAGGWPWGGADRWQGYGAWRVSRAFLLGRIFDQHQLPTISLALGVGLAVAAWRARRDPLLRTLALCFLLFSLFLVGRRSLGHLVDVMPLNLGIQMFRYIGAVHGFGVILAGVGLAAILRFVAGRLPSWALPVIGASLLLWPTINLLVRAGSFFHTIGSYEISTADLEAFGKRIDRSVEAGAPRGRIYCHNKAGSGSHLIAALLGKYSQQPMGQSYGVGMHDALGFYYLETLDPRRETLMALYNFHFALAKAGTRLDGHLRAMRIEPLLQRRDFRLYRLPSRARYFRLVDLDFQVRGTPRAVRSTVRKWLDSPLVLRGQFGEITQRPARGEARPSFAKVSARWRPTAGTILDQRLSPNRYAAQVTLRRPATLMLKVNFHPFWQVTVDGHARETQQVTPSFVGVALSKGRHAIVFQFRNPLYQKLLWLFTPLLWIGLLLPPLVGRRRRGRKEPDSS